MKTIAIIWMLLALTFCGWAQLQNTALTTDSKSQSEMGIAVSPLNANELIGVWADGGS